MRLGLSVQILPDVFIDVIELGCVALGIGNSIISDDHPGGLHQAGFYGIIKAKVAYYPGKERLFAGCLAGGSKRRGREVIAAQDASGADEFCPGRPPIWWPPRCPPSSAP